jgi:tetratricopeptide (TPR) repeat protein
LKTSGQPGWRSYGALCAVTVAAYANSFGLGLALDANRLVREDTRVHAVNAHNLKLILWADYWYPHAQDRLYRPLTTLSFLANYVTLRNGPAPAAYHATNLLLHLVNALLVFALARRLLADPLAAWFAAALWAVHPVTTESVANIAGRSDLLASAAVLGALLVYAGDLRRWRGAALFGLTLAGCLSKESAAVVPALLLLWDLATARKPRVADYVAVLLALAAVFWMRERAFALEPWPELPFLDNPLRGMDFWTARFTAVKVIGMELALLVWPRNLAFDHSYNQIPAAGWRDPWAWLTLAVVVEIAVLVVARRRRDPLPFFAAGFCGIALLPTANLAVLIGSIMAVRFLYLPAVGFALAAAGLIFRLRNRRAAAGILAAAVALLAVRTLLRNPVWANDLALASSGVEESPGSFRTHGLMASGLVLQYGDANLDAALDQAEASWQIVEGLPDERISEQPAEEMAVLCRRKADSLGGLGTAAGRAWYERALEMAEQAARIATVRRRLFDESQAAHGLPPPVLSGYEDVWANLGILQYALGHDRDALESYRKALTEAPDRPDLYDDVMLVYARANDSEGMARTALQKVLVLGVTEATVVGIQAAFGRVPDGGCALLRSATAVQVNYGCPAVRRSLCAAAAQTEAIFHEGRRDRNVREVAVLVAPKGCPAP